jgi:hypothetical protein
MVQIVVLLPSGDHKVMKTAAVPDTGATGAHVAKALRKTKDAKQMATYSWKGHDTVFTIWSFHGSKGATNTHQLPPPHEDLEVVGDMVVTAAGKESAESWVDYYSEVVEGGGGSESDSDSEAEEVEEAEEVDEVEEEEEEEAESESDGEEKAESESDEEAEEEEEEEDEEEEDEEEEEEEDDGCYDDGDEAGGGSKRRAPRRRTIQAPEYRRLDMGLKSKLAMPAPIGKRAPRWQTAPELEPEEY